MLRDRDEPVSEELDLADVAADEFEDEFYLAVKAEDSKHVQELLECMKFDGIRAEFDMRKYYSVNIKRVSLQVDWASWLVYWAIGYTSVISGNVHVLKVLLADARVPWIAPYEEYLKGASEHGHVEIVKLLMQDRRVLLSEFSLGRAIGLASSNDHVDVLKVLMEDARVPAWNYSEALHSASENGHVAVVNMLLTPCLEHSHPMRTIDVWTDTIRSASANGHVDLVNGLLADTRVPQSLNVNDSLVQASAMGHVSVVKVLLASRRLTSQKLACSGINYYPWNAALREASYNGHADVVEVLLADAQIPTDLYVNAIFVAASAKGHVEVVKVFLTSRRLKTGKKYSWSADYDPWADALRLASQHGHVNVVEVLLEDSHVDPSSAVLDDSAIRDVVTAHTRFNGLNGTRRAWLGSVIRLSNV